MSSYWPYIGDFHEVLDFPLLEMSLLMTSVICGIIIGLERESKDKPAGLRTVSLICVGSTIFTVASILMAGDTLADRGRIAAQIVTGIGFLGAGAIIRERGTIVGLTTGATIWTVAAIGVVIGVGYIVAGLVLTLVVLAMLTFVRRFERQVLGKCRYASCRLLYHPDNGKNQVRLLRILDQYHIPDHAWEISTKDDLEILDVKYCHYHRAHRAFLFDMVDIPGIIEFQSKRAPRQDDSEE